MRRKLSKSERMKQGKSQQQLSEESGVTKRAIAYWESGKKKMSIDSAEKVFKALHVTVLIGEQ